MEERVVTLLAERFGDKAAKFLAEQFDLKCPKSFGKLNRNTDND